MSIYHKHHIVPRHMGGSDDPSNLVELTIEEHAEAHRKLFEQYGHWQDEVAWKGLAKMIDHQEVITEVIRNTHKNKILSEEHKQKIRDSKRNISEETRKKLSDAAKRRKHSDQTKQKMSNSRMGNTNCVGRKLSAETRKKIGDSRRSK